MKIINRLLTIPFFVCVFCLPLGLVFLLTSISVLNKFIGFHGDWCFRQWEQPNVPIDEVIDVDEQEY